MRTKGKDDFHVVWRVKYEPGVVKVVSRKDGKTVLEKEIHTAGEPAQIRLTADRNEIKSDGRDLSFVTVEVLDKDGIFVRMLIIRSCSMCKVRDLLPV